MRRHVLALAFAVLVSAVPIMAQNPPRPDTTGDGSGGLKPLSERQTPSRNDLGNVPRPRTTARPAGAGAFYNDRIVRDLASLDRATREMLETAEASPSPNAGDVGGKAARVAKTSRSLWKSLQYGKSGRVKPSSEAAREAASVALSVEDIRAIRRLVGEVAKAMAEEERSREVVVSGRNAVLDRLEQINALALRISAAR